MRFYFCLIVLAFLFSRKSRAQCVDSSPSGDCDQDGIINGLDSDADNDGILDLDECQNLLEESFESLNGISTSFVFPPVSTGIFVDIYALDNSFNINVNGIDLVIDEFQFERGPSTARDSDMIFASDGTRHGRNGNPNIWTIGGGPGDPIVRLKMSGDGQLSILGKRTTNSALEELIVQPGDPQFNAISWNSTAPNTITVNQQVIGPTYINGQIFGLDCNNDSDGDGIQDYIDLDSDNDFCPDAIEGAEDIIYTELLDNTAIDDDVDECGIPMVFSPQGQGEGTSNNPDLMSDNCLSFEVEPSSPSCIGNDDGSIIINVINGTGDFLYELIPGQITQTSNVFEMLIAGDYTILISDPDSNFRDTLDFSISPSTIECLSCQTISMPFDCAATIKGSINVIASGGVPPYCFSISGGLIQKESLFKNLNEGVYTFDISDGSGQTVTCVEEVQLLELPVVQISDIICFGDSLEIGNNVYSSSGMYADTLDSVAGCDSILNLDLQFLDKIEFDQMISLCRGDSLMVGINTYTLDGIYLDTISSFNGCDSIINTELLFFNVPETNQIINICDGDSLIIEGNIYVSPGIYLDTLQSINGCDSLLITELNIIINSEFNQTEDLCAGDTLFVGTSFYTTKGNFIDTLSNAQGCDSIIFSTLDIINQIEFFQEINICPDEFVVVGINIYSSVGEYIDTLISRSGCDSIVTTIVMELENSDSVQSVELCFGDSLAVGSNVYDLSGSYVDVIPNSIGCDSTINTEVIVLEEIFQNQIIELCNGDSIFIGTSIYQETGSYIDSLISYTGCDSIVNTNLTILETEQISESYKLCPGDSIELEMGIFTEDGSFTFFIEEDNACIKELTINIEIEADENCSTLECNTYVPNVFSPNNDGNNDIFQAFSNNVTFTEMLIFDRWGNKLYESTESNPTWDGRFKDKQLLSAVYVALIKGICENGDEVIYVNDFTLLR